MNPWQMLSQIPSPPTGPEAPSDASAYPTFADRYGQPKQNSYEMANPPEQTSMPKNPWAGVTPLSEQNAF